MLPKARIIAALEHQEADRVPVGEIHADWEIVELAIRRPTYLHSKWREWTALWEGRRDEVVASYKRDLVDLTRRFEWDFVSVPLVPARKAEYREPEMLGEYTWPILDDFVEAGVNAWQGIQPPIGMDLKLLKEKYAGRLCFFGGVDVHTLIADTPAAVAEEVKYAIRHAGRGGGLVLTSGNSLMVGTKWDNHQALLSTAREYGRYPITL